MPTIEAHDLRQFAAALLEAAGFTCHDAEATAQLLVWANLRGVDSHGVLRIPRYIEMLRNGLIASGRPMEVTRRFGAVCVLDARKAPGAVAMGRAVEEAGDIAEKYGVGWCAVRDTSHAGAIGYFVQKLAARGKVGIAMTASRPLMTYHGAKGEALSTNPLAIAAPRPDGRDAIIFDMSTAAVALGKIMAAKDADTPIPRGWGVDENGADTDDPHRVASLLPMAGAKGSGLSLMIEMLSSLLVGNANIAPALAGGRPGGLNGTVLALEPAAFGEPQAFLEDVDALANAIHALAPAQGVDRVLLPGERGYQTERTREREGVPVPMGTAKRLIAAAVELGVGAPSAFD